MNRGREKRAKVRQIFNFSNVVDSKRRITFPLKLVFVVTLFLTISFLTFSEVGEPGQLNINMSSPGFSPSMSYQNFGNGEYINTASGGLTVVHNSSLSLPQNMGASLNFTRVYNSKDTNDAYKENGFAPDQVYPNWGFLGPGWKLSFGRVFLRIVKNASNENVSAYFYEDENGTEYKLFPATDDSNNADPKTFGEEWDYSSPDGNKYPYTGLYYRAEDGSFIYALFKNPTSSISESYWILFFPDGTKKICGGTDGFVMPLKSQYNAFCRNEKINGWYCTQIIDKASSSISIAYRGYNPEVQPYAGSIERVTDQFGRQTNFYINENGPQYSGQSFGITGLLSQIEYPDGSSDFFAYTEGVKQYLPDVQSVMLKKVDDPMGLETLYDYQEWTLQTGLTRSYLNKIFYPTGAVAEFSYEPIIEVSNQNGDTTVRPKGDVIKERKLLLGTNVLIWNWDRTTYQDAIGPHLEGESIFDVGFPVLTTDPYGMREIHCFKGNDINDYGAEYYVFSLKPQANPSQGELKNLIRNPETNGIPDSRISFIQKKYWRVPDSHPRDGIFIKRIIEKDSSGSNIIVKTTKRENYDGWGHFGRTTFYEGEGDNPSGDYKEIVNSYYISGYHPVYDQIPEEPLINLTYNLTLLDTIAKGGMGAYKYERRFYDLSGFLTEVREYFSGSTGDYRSTSVSNYTFGNPQTIAYSNSDGSGYSFTQNLNWSYGVLASLNWSGFSYNEFSRSVNAMGRITSETDSNNLTTSFDYDALGRVIQISPPGGEVPTYIEYPLTTKTTDGITWAIGNVIKFYKGNNPMPSDIPANGEVNFARRKRHLHLLQI